MKPEKKFDGIVQEGLAAAIRLYWETRTGQVSQTRQGGAVQDQGRRAEVTGGKQLDGFLHVVCEILKLGGLKHPEVFTGMSDSYLPGFFRPTKRWDLLAIADGHLIACLEVKSQVGPSFGNNFNNRVEEAIGNAHDFWRAYQVEAFKRPPAKPFLGFLMILEHCDKSTSPVRVEQPHYAVLQEFQGASYAKRYELFCEKAHKEGLYDATAFLMASQEDGLRGRVIEPNATLTFRNLAAALYGRAVTFCQQRGG
jgi:hypothetical protein